MLYIIGTIPELNTIRAAIDVLAGLPRPTAIPSPPRAATYSEGAFGWVGHLIAPPVEVGGTGSGYMEMPDDTLPYLGQSAEVEGQTIAVPADRLELEALPTEYQAQINDPGDISGGGGP